MANHVGRFLFRRIEPGKSVKRAAAVLVLLGLIGVSSTFYVAVRAARNAARASQAT